MKPIAAVVATALVAAGLAGCAEDAGTLGPASTGPAATSPKPARVATVPRRPAVLYEVWLVRDGLLYSVQREGPSVSEPATRSLRALATGPTPQEARDGVSTAVAARPSVAIEDGIATVTVDRSFTRGSRRTRRLREAQVVFTLTKYPTVRGVRFTSTDSHQPGPVLTRRNLRDLMPPIVVDEPRGGDTVHSPLVVTGTADVFEATVTLRLLDGAGKEIARTFTTATCGTGCRGDFTASVPYAVDRTQNGTLEVFEVSARDGSPLHLVAVPVRLSRLPRAPAG